MGMGSVASLNMVQPAKTIRWDGNFYTVGLTRSCANYFIFSGLKIARLADRLRPSLWEVERNDPT